MKNLPAALTTVACIMLLILSSAVTSGFSLPLPFDSPDDSGCCVGLVATGKICKDQRSILWKNRHFYTMNQHPFFYKGDKYTFFGVGGTYGQCRMGMNEKGLSIGNFDVNGPLDHWSYVSDGSSGSEDNDQKIPLGNFSTVSETAWWLAHHAYYGAGRQWGIISAEQGVGAVVAIDTQGHSNITWVNNTYAVFANAFYCDGDHDPDGTDIRAQELFEDLLTKPTSNVKSQGINWRDICQLLATDTHDKEDGEGTYSYAGEISGTSAFSAMVAVSGTPLLHMAWLNIGRTTQISIFLPLSASYLQSEDDIPKPFRDGNGIQQYSDVKFTYASAGSNQYYCDRVREIQHYTFWNENLTFHMYDLLKNRVSSCTNKAMIRYYIKQYVECAVTVALQGYVHNSTNGPLSTTSNAKEPPIMFNVFVPFLPGLSTTYGACSSQSFTKLEKICSPYSVCSTSG